MHLRPLPPTETLSDRANLIFTPAAKPTTRNEQANDTINGKLATRTSDKHLPRLQTSVTPNQQGFKTTVVNTSAQNIMTAPTPLGTVVECESLEQLETTIKAGTHPSRILYTNPHRSPASLRLAARLGVENIAVDSCEDLSKIRAHHPRARLLLRVNASKPSEKAPGSFELADATEVACDMLEEATSLGLKVSGVRFHVGCGATSYEIYTDSDHLSKPAHPKCVSLATPLTPHKLHVLAS